MQVETVKSILAKEAGDTVAAFKGRVKKVFDQTAGTSDGGKDWKKQGFIAHDGTFEISVTLWGHSQLKAGQWEGQVIYILAEEGGKPLKVSDYKNKVGKVVRQLQVDESATLTRDDGAAAPSSAPTPTGPASKPANGTGPTAKVFSAQAAQAMLLAMRGATYVVTEAKVFVTPGFDGPELFASVASDLFGAMERAGYIPTFPVGAKPQERKPEPEPEPEPEPPPPEASATPPPDDDVPF